MGRLLLQTLVSIALGSPPLFSNAQTGGGTGDPNLSLTPLPLNKTYPAGTPSAIQGAPALPAASINANQYPPLDKVPPTDSDVVKSWITRIDMSKVPNIPPTGLDGCSNTTFNADAIAKSGPDNRCWWTCGNGCTRSTDITVCPSKGTWGATFDDGPSEYTPNVLQYLDQNKLKATFFIVGSRAISHPEILRAEYMASHQLCIHTWSHPSLTTLTNEQIVAEMAWSMKAFKDILGVVPNCARPPYADVDDRVRYIFNAMGLKTVLWTRNGDDNFDTNDWRTVDGSTTAQQAVQKFQGILSSQSSLSTGFIVLAHDLFPQTVALSLNNFLPSALKSGLKVQPVSTCSGQSLAESYFETSGKGDSSTNSTAGKTGSSKPSTGGPTPSGSAVLPNQSANPGKASTSSPSSGSSFFQIPLGYYSFFVGISLMSIFF